MDKLPSFEAFKRHFDDVSRDFELHRKKHISYFPTAIFFALLLLVIMLPAIYYYSDGSLGYLILGILIWTPFALYIAVFPILKYRGKNRTAGLMATKIPEEYYKALKAGGTLITPKYSLKDQVYSRLVSFFGAFEFAPAGEVSRQDLKNASILGSYDRYVPEDLIIGIANEMKIQLADSKIIKIIKSERVSTFQGLIVLIDICNVGIKLRGTFSGRTVVINDNKKHHAWIQERYKNLTRIDLNDEKLETLLEAFSDTPNEAKQLLSKNLFESIFKLSTALSNLKDQHQHWDDKIAYLLEYYFYKTNSYSDSAILDEEKEFAASQSHDVDLSKSDALLDDETAFNDQIQLEFYDDKILITIPCKHDLFETNSIFEPALVQEDADVLYAIMQLVFNVTGNVKQYLDSRSNS